MHPQRIGVILGFFLLTLLDITDFAHGKAFPEDSEEGKYKYRYKQELGTQFQPFYSHQSFPPKNKLYYTPHINGQPIYIPAISGSASQTNKLLHDYYERNKEYTQSWTLATPVTYDYGHGNQRDYYEDPVTSYSIVKNLLDGTYEGGVHHESYHILPIKPGSHPNYGSEQTNKDFKVKNKSNKQNLRKKDKKKKPNKDFLGLSTKNPVSVHYEAKTMVSDYPPEVVDLVGPKLLDDDYAPEVVDVVGTKLGDDDYAPEVVDVVGTKLGDDDYAPEVVDVVNIKTHGSEELHLPKTEAVLRNLNDKDSDEAIIQETFTSKKDKTKVKSDKKQEKTPSSSSIKTADSEEIKSVNNKSDKQKYKKQSQFAEKSETSSEPNNKHIITSEVKPVTEHLDAPYKTENIESSLKSNADTNKKSSQKIKMKSTTKPASKDEYVTDKIHKVIKRKEDISIDYSESPLDKYGKTESSSHESTGYLSEGTALLEDESKEILRSIDSHEDLSEEEPFNTPGVFEGFDLENLGSGEDIRSGPLFSNIESIKSLSSLNSNIWSLIFNPTAELRKLKKCVTRSNETGFCMYAHQCDVPNIATSLEQLLNNACVIDDIFIGICCPEFPVQSVKVHWEQMPSNSDKRTEHEFGHNAEDCGIRSDKASKAQSWPWKAPLVSMSNGKIFCGGVVINEDYILTAAHCTTKIPKNQILVRLGQHDDSSGEDFAVVEIKRHAQYNPRILQNDIALLKLGRRIVHDEYTDAICLPDDDEEEEDDDHDHSDIRAVLLGWQGSYKKNSMKDELLEVMTHKECEKKIGVKVPATLLCTEARNVNERTCNADSGAPLVRKDDDKYEVIGILSWNRNDCDQRFPSTFSRVSKYVPWIKKHAV